MKRHGTRMLIAVAALVAGTAAVAQTPATTQRPTPIGTSQATADDASRKAVPDGSAATVVRTGPSAADKVGDATSSTKHAATRKKSRVKSTARTDGDAVKP